MIVSMIKTVLCKNSDMSRSYRGTVFGLVVSFVYLLGPVYLR